MSQGAQTVAELWKGQAGSCWRLRLDVSRKMRGPWRGSAARVTPSQLLSPLLCGLLSLLRADHSRGGARGRMSCCWCGERSRGLTGYFPLTAGVALHHEAPKAFECAVVWDSCTQEFAWNNFLFAALPPHPVQAHSALS